jgi:hypothetical protein
MLSLVYYKSRPFPSMNCVIVSSRLDLYQEGALQFRVETNSTRDSRESDRLKRTIRQDQFFISFKAKTLMTLEPIAKTGYRLHR